MAPPIRKPTWRPMTPTRSEEHTSELQSHLNHVCRLLLEKTKQEAPHPKRPGLHQPADDHSLQRIGLGQDTNRHGQSIAWSFFCIDAAPTEIYTLSLHDALPIRMTPT